jgi:UDP-N-acetylmuramoyl-L-alanyl-D-glutamate--2,6-diaminopimelate ligase
MQLPLLLRGIDPLEITGRPDGEVASVCYDSRSCTEGCLFVAIPGLKADGHAFIADALARGARFIVHERNYSPPPGVTSLRVHDSRRILGILGKNYFHDPSAELSLIAVVGTNGKTTITYLLESILQAAGHTVGVLGTVNYRYRGKTLPAPNTTPESFEMQRILREMKDQGITHVVAEVSSHALDLKRADDCAFDLGIFTNLTQDHLDYHGTMENYFQAKKRFFSEVLPRGGKTLRRQMIVNMDDPWGRRILQEVQGSRLSYGIETAGDLAVDSFRLSLDGIDATLRLDEERFTLTSPLTGRYNLSNILAAVAGASAIGTPIGPIQEGIAALGRVPGRLERVGEKGQPAVFVDYAHTDDALRRVLETLCLFRKGRIITVFGCGGDRDRGKRPLMGEAATEYSELSIVTSDNPRTEDPLSIIREIEAGIRVTKLADAGEPAREPAVRGYLVIPDRKEAIAAAIGLAHSGDIVLIAGKGHEDYQIIGTRKIPFDDRMIARDELKRWPSARKGP